MKKYPLFFALVCSISFLPKINAQSTSLSLDSIPASEINIPIQVNLKPYFAMAEKSVDLVFTSPNYPNGWVNEGCDTRYKYSFRRSLLQMKPEGNALTMWFTGYYKIIGATRACIGNTAVSPWTPDCSCGINEPERRVNISFTNSITVLPDYKIKLNIKRNDPVPIDKCEVCFWGQDVTKQVLKGLTAELDASKTELEKQYGTIDLKPEFQKVWDALNTVYSLNGLGFLKVNPERLRIDNFFVRNDSLHIMLGLTAKPMVSFEKPKETSSWIPNISDKNTKAGFNIFLDAKLNYDSLSHLLNTQLANQEFDFKKGPIKKKFIIDRCKVYGENNDKLIIRVDFSGTNKGVVYLSGTPVFNASTKLLELTNVEFDLKSKNALLKFADLFFTNQIVKAISQQAHFDLSDYLTEANEMLNQQLNQEWMKGISSKGSINTLTITGIYPTYRHLLIRTQCGGNLAVSVGDIDFSF